MQQKTHPLAALADMLSEQLFGPHDHAKPQVPVGDLSRARDSRGRPVPFNTPREHVAIEDRMRKARAWIVGRPVACSNRVQSVLAARRRYPQRCNVVELWQRIDAEPNARQSAVVIEFVR